MKANKAIATYTAHAGAAAVAHACLQYRAYCYVAFVIDVFARCIVGWRVSSSMRNDFVMDVQEHALYADNSKPLTR